MAYDILWRLHAILMCGAFLCMCTGAVISLLYKKRKWRYKTHKTLGISAGILGISAFIIAFVMVQLYGAHFTSFHGGVGFAAALLLILTPTAGLRIRRSKNKKRARLLHKTMGYLTLATMALNVTLGLLLAIDRGLIAS